MFLPANPTPMSLFNSLLKDGQQQPDHHSAWLDEIRERIWSRITYEEEMTPSYDVLFKHWKRSCWVLSVWGQAHMNNITYPTLQDYGWKQPDSKTLSIDWDSDNNVSEIRARVALIKRGCGCKTGCHTARCKCKKAGHHCGPGCKCLSCVNLPSEATHHSTCIDTESSSDSDDNFEEEVDSIMNEVFGEFQFDYDSHSDTQDNNMDTDLSLVS